MNNINSLKFIIFFIFIFSCNNTVFSAQVGNVVINGTVPIRCDIVVVPEAVATNITDISLGATDLHVATVTEDCNDPDGYTVTLISANAGNHTGLLVDLISGDSHPFTLTYDGVSVPVGGVISNTSAPGLVSKELDITFSADSDLTGTTAATYSETITVTISAK